MTRDPAGSPAPTSADRPPLERMPLPHFVIIGAQKSGTRWLRYNLGLHPEIYTPPVEPNFFIADRADHPEGLEWYRSHFTGWAGERLVGEATPAYMIWHHDPARSARRMHRILPEAAPIAILRNPIDRAYSAVVHHIRKGRLPEGAHVVELARRPPDPDRLSLITGGWYAASLAPYVERFGARLLVILHDDVLADPAACYRRVLRHIGADPDFVPDGLDEVRFTNRSPRAGDDAGDARSELSRPPTAEERAELYGHFEADVRALEDLLGRDLSAWRPR